MPEYTSQEDALTHQEWVAEHYIIDLETGRIIKSEE